MVNYLRILLFLFLPLAACKRQAAERPDFPVPVKTAQVSVKPLREEISLVGTLTANEAVEIKPEISGMIEAIHFEEGQPVEKDQLLVEIEDEKLRAQLAQIEADYELAKSNFERAERLLQGQTLSRQEFDQAKGEFAAREAQLNLFRRQLADTRIVAPFDGVTGARHVSPGQYIEPGTTITRLVDLTPVKAEFQVPERFLSALTIGQKIESSSAAFPRETFTGEVYFISPQVDETSRTVLLKARIPNEDLRLKPGMFVSLELVIAVKERAILIPEQALTVFSEKPVVFVVNDGVAHMQHVETGIRRPGEVEIINGLKPGQTIITAGLQKVRPGAKVIDTEKQAPPPGKG